MRVQPKSDRDERGEREQAAVPITIAQRAAAANAVHQMQRDVLTRLNGDKGAPRRGTGVPLHAIVTVPGVIVGAACVMPLAVVAFGLNRLARGQINGLGADTAGTARAIWQATGAAIAALTDRRASRR